MHPILIAGAALVGLPILLHLIMKQEPRRLPFPAVRFLKQKQRVNQRKMRLRHFLLLALRVLLLALFCAALFQPRVPSEGLSLGGEQPVAVVFVVDTSPSMGYTAEGKTRLDEARRRAVELLDALPPGSRAAVLDPNDPVGGWEQSLGDARRKIDGLKEPAGGGPPVTAALPTAYQLFRALDDESDSEEKLPRLVAVFSDRTPAAWKADRADDLKRAAQAVPPPAVAHLFFDVGADVPANVAVLAADPRPQLAPADAPVTLAVTVQATGPDVPSAEVSCALDDAAVPERKEIRLPAGSPVPVTFTFKDLKPGFHKVRVSVRDDALAADNVRYATFRVGEGRRILTVCDDPDAAAYWQFAHRSKGEFACDVATPDKLPDLGGYEVVCLLSVANPARSVPGGGTLWERLRQYVEKGGKVLLIPGGDAEYARTYDPGRDDTQQLLPAHLKEVITVPADQDGREWDLSDDALRHPFLAPFKEWRLRQTVDFFRNPRRVRRYWLASDYQPGTVVVRYKDAPKADEESPAVLEKTFPSGGKVLLLTTRLDTPWGEQEKEPWHNYWESAESSWPVVFPHLLVRYLAGDTAEVAYNFPTAQAVALPLPKGEAGAGRKLVLEGPGVSGPDAFPAVGERQTELRLPPVRTLTAGNYLLRTEDRSWQEGFSLNPPAEEFNLTKVPVEAVEGQFGKGSVVPVGKEFRLKDALEKRSARELQLFPWLLIGVLFLIAAEGLVANRFYRFRGPPPA